MKQYIHQTTPDEGHWEYLTRFVHNKGKRVPKNEYAYVRINHKDALIPYNNSQILVVQVEQRKDGIIARYTFVPGIFIRREGNVSFVEPTTSPTEQADLEKLLKPSFPGPIYFGK